MSPDLASALLQFAEAFHSIDDARDAMRELCMRYHTFDALWHEWYCMTPGRHLQLLHNAYNVMKILDGVKNA